MYHYQAYGLRINSAFVLPELTPAPPTDDAEVTVRWLLPHEALVEQTTGATAFWVETPGGRFLLRNECEILVEATPGVSELSMRTHLLGPILAALLRLRGLLVLHASGVALAGGAVLFLGDSGWGKSTLAQAFCARGHQLIADDVNAIATEQESLTVLPGFPQLKLWPDAAATLLPAANRMGGACAQAPKQHHRLAAFADRPLPLKHIYVLGNTGLDASLRPLSTQEAMLALIRFSRYAIIPTRRDLQARHLQQCAQVASRIPISYVVRQRSLARISVLAEIIERELTRVVA
jgi:hypothetical protein